MSVEEVTVSTSQKTQEFVTLPIEFVNISQVESNIVEVSVVIMFTWFVVLFDKFKGIAY